MSTSAFLNLKLQARMRNPLASKKLIAIFSPFFTEPNMWGELGWHKYEITESLNTVLNL